jgi:hypothetical protein
MKVANFFLCLSSIHLIKTTNDVGIFGVVSGYSAAMSLVFYSTVPKSTPETSNNNV